MGHPSKWHFLSHLSRDEILGITKGLFWKRFWGKTKKKYWINPWHCKIIGISKNWGIQKTNFMFFNLSWSVLFGLFCHCTVSYYVRMWNQINLVHKKSTTKRNRKRPSGQRIWVEKLVSSLEKRRGGQPGEVWGRGVQKRADGVHYNLAPQPRLSNIPSYTYLHFTYLILQILCISLTTFFYNWNITWCPYINHWFYVTNTWACLWARVASG